MRIFSAFTGIGGFELGILQAFDEMEQRRCRQEKDNLETTLPNTISEPGKRQYATLVGYSEIDKYAIQIYERHFPEVTNYGDITAIIADELPDFDCFVGGFPCQAFSIAGKRRGFEDTRGTLFFDIARILQAKQPSLFVLENVKGLLSHDGGRTFKIIISTLAELGYCVQWDVLNSKNFGVPQNRERVFIVGNTGGEPLRKVFPVGTCNEKDTRVVGEDVAYCIDANYAKGTHNLERSVRSLVRKEAQAVLTPERKEKRQDGRRMKTCGEPMFTLTSQDIHGVSVGPRIRRLTPVECERLQGFPDNWTAEVSDTQRYKCLGNAVTTNVVQAVFERILVSLKDNNMIEGEYWKAKGDEKYESSI